MHACMRARSRRKLARKDALGMAAEILRPSVFTTFAPTRDASSRRVESPSRVPSQVTPQQISALFKATKMCPFSLMHEVLFLMVAACDSHCESQTFSPRFREFVQRKLVLTESFSCEISWNPIRSALAPQVVRKPANQVTTLISICTRIRAPCEVRCHEPIMRYPTGWLYRFFTHAHILMVSGTTGLVETSSAHGDWQHARS